MTFRAAFSILATTAAVWAASGPACDRTSDINAAAGVPDEVFKTPTSIGPTLEVGTKVNLTLRVMADGRPAANQKVAWSLSSAAGSVSQDTTTTDAAGNTTVEWTLATVPRDISLFAKVLGNENLRVSWSVQTVLGPLAKVVATPDTIRLDVNGTSRITTTTSDRFNNPVTGTVTFQSLENAIATVVSDGTVTARTPGTARIVASAGTGSDTTIVVVRGVTGVVLNSHALQLNEGAESRLTATVLGLPGATVNWSSTVGTVASVDASGLVKALTAGTTRIIASAGTKADTAVVTVSAVAQTTVTISAQNPIFVKRLAAGDTMTDAGMYAGDHEANGDKTIQGFVTYNLANLPASATVSSAKVTIATDAAQTEGNPYTLGPLFVERATLIRLNEGTPAGIQVLTAAQPQGIVVDVTTLLNSARAAGSTELVLRFRFQNLVNNNGAIDYVGLTASALTVRY
jgi:hypothetical protein